MFVCLFVCFYLELNVQYFFYFKDAWKMMNVNVLSVTMVRDAV